MEIKNPNQQQSPAQQPPQNSASDVEPARTVIEEEDIYQVGDTTIVEETVYTVPQQTPQGENAVPNTVNASNVPPVPPTDAPPTYQQQPQDAPQPQPQSQQAAYQQPQQQQPYQTLQYIPTEPSAFSKAWQDVKNTPDAFKSLGFKGLVGCVPILNFVLYGLAGKWDQQLIDGTNAPMPKKTVDTDNFVKGFFYVVIAFILGVILGIVNVIPVIGQLAFFVGCFFVTTVSCVMFQRYIAFGSFGEAFAVKDVFDKMKRNFGELWVATFVPQLIVGAIAGLAAFVVMMLFGGVSLLGIATAAGTGSVGGMLAGLGSLGLGGIISFVIAMFASVIGIFWSMRGCAWWIQKNVPEWTSANAGVVMAQKRAEEQARAAAAQQQYQAQQAAQQAQYQAQYVQPQYQQPAQPQQPVQPVQPVQTQQPQQSAQPEQSHQPQGYYPPQQ